MKEGDPTVSYLKIGMVISFLLIIILTHVLYVSYTRSQPPEFYDLFNVSAVTKDNVNVDIEFKLKSSKRISEKDLTQISGNVITKVSSTSQSELYETSPAIFNEYVDFIDGSLVSSITTQDETFISGMGN